MDMNAAPDSYLLAIEADETTTLILAQTLADWNLSVHLPDGAGLSTLKIFCTTRTEAESRLGTIRALAPRMQFGAVIVKPVARQDWAQSWKRFFHAQREIGRASCRERV